MFDKKRIPIVIGVTGHRNYIGEQEESIRNLVVSELKRVKDLCPNSPLIFLSSLAEGADRLCAEKALEEGYSLIAVLPMRSEEYEKDFSQENLENYKELLNKADKVFVAPNVEPFKDGREYCYRQADIYVAEHCHELIAVWDGSEPIEGGCGTAETVDMRLNGSFESLEERNICPYNGVVAHISVSRTEEDTKTPECVYLGDKKTFDTVLKRTDAFNKEVAATKASDRLSATDIVSMTNQKKVWLGLFSIAVLATAITTAFLLYDEASLHILIIACGILICALFLIVKISDKNRYHLRYLESRVLAEALRIGEYMDKNAAVCPSDLFSWSMWTDNPWIGWALRAIAATEQGQAPRGEGAEFTESQKRYHEKALKRVEKKNRTNNIILAVALTITVISYVSALVFEITAGGLLNANPLLSVDKLEFYRAVLKIVMGVMSAATLFAGNYYGKLCLAEEADDHKRMLLLIANAKNECKETLSYKLVREILGENARWYSYKSRGKAEISL